MSGLPDVPAVARTIADLRDTFRNACGVGDDAIVTLVDPDEPSTIASALRTAAKEASRVLVFYFVGHGLVGVDKQLYLATRSASATTPTNAYEGALPIGEVQKILRHPDSRASTVVTILDCCFAGRAPQVAGEQISTFVEPAGYGAYQLAAAAPDSVALAPPGADHTLFSGALIDLLRHGDARSGRRVITLEGVYRSLRTRLPPENRPRPKISGGTAGDLVLCRNFSYEGPDNGAAAVSIEPPAEIDCPYLGLTPYKTEDARWFRGREKLTGELLSRVGARLTNPGMLIVEGRSGAGKSSVIHAGLIPALQRGGVPGSEAWKIVSIEAGSRPLEVLSGILAPMSEQSARMIYQELVLHPTVLSEYTQRVLERYCPVPEESRLVLIVDQFEQALAPGDGNSVERTAFLDALIATSNHAKGALVVLVLRADFHPLLYQHPPLVDLLNRNAELFFMQEMTEGELHAAITEPADEAGLVLEDGLVGRILRDASIPAVAGKSSGIALPFISYALARTWSRRRGATLTHAGYESVGGIAGAVAQAADSLFNSFDIKGQEACESLFTRLVSIGTDTPDTHRPLPLDIVDIHPSGRSVAEAFVRARLLTVDESTIQITHDALITGWPKLREWIDDERGGHLHRQVITEAARRWQTGGGRRWYARPDRAEKDALEWAETRGASLRLTVVERDWVNACQRRARTLRRGKVAGIASILVAVLIAGACAAVKNNRANSERERAFVQGLISASEASLDHDPSLASLLAAEAVERSNSPDVRAGALDLVQKTTGARAPLPYAGPVKTAGSINDPHPELSVDSIEGISGTSKVLISTTNGAWTWDLEDHTARKIYDAPSKAIHPAPDARSFFIIPFPDKQIEERSLTGEKGSSSSLGDFTDQWQTIEDVDSSGRLAAWLNTYDGSYGIRREGQPPHRLGVHQTRKEFGVFTDGRAKLSPSGDTLAVFTTNYGDRITRPEVPDTGNFYKDGEITIWDLKTDQLTATIPVSGKFIRKFIFDPTGGHWLATLTTDGLIQFWDLTNAAAPIAGLPFVNCCANGSGGTQTEQASGRTADSNLTKPFSEPPSSYGGFEDMAVNPGGTVLAVAGKGGTYLWSIADRAWLNIKLPTKAVARIGYSPNGSNLVIAAQDGAVFTQNIVDLSPTEQTPRAISVSGDGKTVIERRADSVWQWDLRTEPPTASRIFRLPESATSSPSGKSAFAINYNGSRIAFLANGQVEIWDVANRRRTASIGGIGDAIRKLAVSEDGKFFATLGRYGLQFWSVDQGRPLGPVHEKQSDLSMLTSLPGDRLAAGGPGVMSSWSFSEGKVISSWLVDNLTVETLSGDRSTAVLEKGDEPAGVEIWNTNGWSDNRPQSYRSTVRFQQMYVGHLSLSFDGKLLFVSDFTGITVWDTASGRQLGIGPLPGSQAGSLAIAPEGGLTAFAEDGSPVQRYDPLQWTVDSHEIIGQLCRTAGRDFTQDEWNEYLPSKKYHSTCGTR